MTRVGTLVNDPKAGGDCKLTLDSGQRIIVNHDQGGFKGGSLTILEVKWMGLGAGETLYTLDLHSAQGKAVMARLTKDAAPGTADATPLGAFVNYVRDCKTMADVKSKCAAIPV